MQIDEARHAQAALERGGIPLSFPLRQLMALSSAAMKSVAYRI
jgi:ubiquinone biosynthesis monooxygenase Coq7